MLHSAYHPSETIKFVKIFDALYLQNINRNFARCILVHQIFIITYVRLSSVVIAIETQSGGKR